jgi:hypothetical protein
MPTLTWEEVTIREGKGRCGGWTKMEIMSLVFYLKVIYYLRARSCAYRNASNTRKCIFWCQKESYHVLDHFVRDSCWMTIGWPLDRSIFTSYPYELVLLLIPIQQYFSWFDFLWLDEILNQWTYWIRWWICESSPCHTSSIWPWSDVPKVPSYGT